MKDRKLAIVSTVIAAIAVVISLLVFIFGDGIIWRGESSNSDSLSTGVPKIENIEDNSIPPSIPSDTDPPDTDNTSAQSATLPSNNNNNSGSNNSQENAEDSGTPSIPSGIDSPAIDSVPAQSATSPSNNNIDTNNSGSNSPQASIIAGIQTNTTSSGLSLIIEDYEYFYDGFYHQIPEGATSYSYVEFDQGISGHFSYSRELTATEYENWGHGGEILDASGNKYEPDANFYATTDGVFAMEFPDGISNGNYTYLLYLVIDGEYCEARIPFSIG